MSYLRLIRYQNLIFIALAQFLIRYGLFEPFGAVITLNDIEFALLVVATLCIAAGGNIINDIYDVEIDRVNKPNRVLIGKAISETSANRLFIALNVIGVGLGFYLSNSIGKPGFAALFIIFSALLYLYASSLKKILILGNLIVSILVAMSLIIIPIFDLLPAITLENRPTQSMIFKMTLDYAFFALFLTFIREIVKDLQDINGDKKGGVNTLAIVIRRKRTTALVSILGMGLTFWVIFYMYQNLYAHQLVMLFFLLGIVAPLLYFCVKAWGADKNREYAFLSILLKGIMFMGICSMLFLQFTL